MSKLTHCNRWFAHRESVVLECEARYADKFNTQVMLVGWCPTCKEERRAWFGIYHDGLEDANIYGIKPRNYGLWDIRVRSSARIKDEWASGSLSVMVQREWDGKFTNEMTMQKVR